MAPVTTPGKKVKASKADPHDPKQILKARHLRLYEHLGEADTMTTESVNMEKDIKDMTKEEILSAIADEGDKNRLSSLTPLAPPPGDPSTWKFEGRLQELLDAYNAKFVPEEPYLADDVEHFCICNGEDDGRAMIECSNGKACLMNWFHFECIGMSLEECPDEKEDWFCQRCIDKKVGKLRKNAPSSISKSIAKKPNAARIKNYEVVEHAVADKKSKKLARNQKTRAKAKEKEKEKKKQQSTTSSGYLDISTPSPGSPEVLTAERNTDKEKQKKKQQPLTISTTSSGYLDMSTPSPGSPNAWTAELDKTFVEDPEVIETYSLGSATTAKAALRLRAANDATNASVSAKNKTAANDDDGDLERSGPASEPTATMAKGSWAEDEKKHLIACVTATKAAGHCGELLWNDVLPRMVALGVNRPLGGMRNTWLRGLREQTGIDERRRENPDNLTTAVQKPKKQKEAEKAAAKGGKTKGARGMSV